jgi:hypothetical protein
MNSDFFESLQPALAAERLDAYRQDQAGPLITLARYLWNMALCESLYSPLQMVEVALRNSLQRALEDHFHTPRWYDEAACSRLLTSTQQTQIVQAKQNLQRWNKPDSPGRVVAELTFGFWTAFFNKRFAQSGDVVRLAADVFHGAPKSQRDLRSLNRRLTRMRDLRNRVFHHERIIHWRDLDEQHASILEVIGWMAPELRELAEALDRYSEIRVRGLDPWTEKLSRHWPST